jgi:hypothetical protein
MAGAEPQAAGPNRARSFRPSCPPAVAPRRLRPRRATPSATVEHSRPHSRGDGNNRTSGVVRPGPHPHPHQYRRVRLRPAEVVDAVQLHHVDRGRRGAEVRDGRRRAQGEGVAPVGRRPGDECRDLRRLVHPHQRAVDVERDVRLAEGDEVNRLAGRDGGRRPAAEVGRRPVVVEPRQDQRLVRQPADKRGAEAGDHHRPPAAGGVYPGRRRDADRHRGGRHGHLGPGRLGEPQHG